MIPRGYFEFVILHNERGWLADSKPRKYQPGAFADTLAYMFPTRVVIVGIALGGIWESVGRELGYGYRCGIVNKL